MRQNGVSGLLLKHFQNYLNNRKQPMVLNGFSADYSIIEYGVPQGSILRTLLFLIYINNLERNIKSNVTFFTGDTMLLAIVNDPVISANELNHDLKVINQRAYPDPNKQTTELLFSLRKIVQTIHLFSSMIL